MDSKATFQTVSHSVVCPQCRNLMSYSDYPRSKYFGCPECGSYFTRSADGVSQLICRFDPENKITPDFPLGTQFRGGTLVAYVYKKDPKEDFYWTEYLFAQTETSYYLTLADVDGYWMAVARDPDQQQYLDNDSGTPVFHRPFLSYQFELAYAVGEFNWDIRADEQLLTNEFLSGEYIIINEAGNGQSDWYRGAFIAPDTLAGELSQPMERLSPRKYFNPKTFYPAWRVLVPFSGGLTGLFLLVFFLLKMVHPEKTVFQDNFECQPDTTAWSSGGVSAAAQLTPVFHIDGTGAIEIKASCISLSNSWLELELSLVNNQTGQEYEADKTLEYYYGYEDGENWNEGSQEGTVSFSSVPPGDYHLNIFPTLPPGTVKATDGSLGRSYRIAVVEFGALWGNFVTTLLLLLAYPIIQFCRKSTYENNARNTKIYGALPGNK